MKTSVVRPTEQVYENYRPQDFKVWKSLFEKQMQALDGIVAQEFTEGLAALGFNANEIPNFNQINKVLSQHTGWKIKTVPNIAAPDLFFTCLAKKEFTATCWLRTIEELNYIEEPDMFHDVFGHMPMLTNKAYTDFFEQLGVLSLQFIDNEVKLTQLQRLYWFTIEFGLIRSGDNYKIYGAGIMSSNEEKANVYSERSKKEGFDLARIMQQDFRVDIVQDTYFVIESFEALVACLPEVKEILLN